MSLLVHWTPLAIAHLQSTYEYIAQDNSAAAERVVGEIFAGVERLERYPNMGRTGRLHGTRELAIPGRPFVVAYRVQAGRVEVLAVFHTSRKWPDSL